MAAIEFSELAQVKDTGGGCQLQIATLTGFARIGCSALRVTLLERSAKPFRASSWSINERDRFPSAAASWHIRGTQHFSHQKAQLQAYRTTKSRVDIEMPRANLLAGTACCLVRPRLKLSEAVKDSEHGAARVRSRSELFRKLP